MVFYYYYLDNCWNKSICAENYTSIWESSEIMYRSTIVIKLLEEDNGICKLQVIKNKYGKFKGRIEDLLIDNLEILKIGSDISSESRFTDLLKEE